MKCDWPKMKLMASGFWIFTVWISMKLTPRLISMIFKTVLADQCFHLAAFPLLPLCAPSEWVLAGDSLRCKSIQIGWRVQRRSNAREKRKADLFFRAYAKRCR